MKQAIRRTDSRFDARTLFRRRVPEPAHSTALGALWDRDCMAILPALDDGVIDTIFADPPFNLGKVYGASTSDSVPEHEYASWCRSWIGECVRALKPGGAFFLYHLPRWNIVLGAHLFDLGMQFRHWIAIEISSSFPIPGRLHPSHYGLLYFTKGRPRIFRRVRTPIATCRHCGREVKDYGGHRDAMNPKGVNLKDVWTDVPPVRHWRFKSKQRRANALSTKILDRVVEMSTVPGDLVLDPFGGSGTTYAVCEAKQRRWIGAEIDFAPEIIHRIQSGSIRGHPNADFVEGGPT